MTCPPRNLYFIAWLVLVSTLSYWKDALARGPLPGANTSNVRSQIFYDGALTSAGIVRYELSLEGNLHGFVPVYGMVVGYSAAGTPEILLTSESVGVVAENTSRFDLNVPEGMYQEWKRKFAKLTVGIGFSNAQDQDQWKYKNKLKPGEGLRGIQLVKGSFEKRR